MSRYQKPISILILCLIFTTWFLYNTKSDFPLIFKKDLLAHDESSNSVVAANTTRKFFPPMVRVNPLVETQGNWMEGPFWQHIPPQFAYVPYLFFKLDGQVTIEVKRLSYAFLTLLTGLLFIFGVYNYRKNIWAGVGATIAAIFWINTPFTHELITGYAFGVSDIVLAFTVVASFVTILWYLRGEGGERREYKSWQLAVVSLVVALPIMAKNLLGAIPAATFFCLLIYDNRKINKRVLISITSFVTLLLLYYLPLYFASPSTFKSEIFVSFLHFKQLEGWTRPWYWYITNYLPQRYLFGWTWVYYLGLILAIGLRFKDKRFKTLWLSGGWFLWNLVAISLVTSKVPNFIYQTYLLSIYFIVYSLLQPIPDLIRDPLQKLKSKGFYSLIILVFIISISVTAYETVRFGQQFQTQRALAYNYQSEHEKFYQTAEELKKRGAGTGDLVLVFDPPNDCWLRYYVLFLTGAESKTLLEMNFLSVPYDRAKKYRKVYFVDRNLSVREFDLTKLSNVLTEHKADIEKEVQEIKKNKASCQWLVPDEILNAP